ncbi:PREDICTED: retinoic acid receptor responder protein 3 [Odobenus rosmarus divergens]|uniref:Retinoic acid receptor responder protein 3 n=1 Tax=Odobenus rosmarus divergens TaxID=9708 RepID=A0A2U3WWD6_ODORO|nr:PREDICTED: retinoic acid receptor responder protein 3 [Odobenus rosmarus divergens]
MAELSDSDLPVSPDVQIHTVQAGAGQDPTANEELRPGDLIEIFRTGYEHWATYVGDSYVIHLTSPSEFPEASSSRIFSILSNRAVVRRDLLWDVVGSRHYRVNNLLDNKYRPQPVNQIIYSAKQKVGQEMEYSLLRRNCEHFVTGLRYGEPESRQEPLRLQLFQVTGVSGCGETGEQQGRHAGLADGQEQDPSDSSDRRPGTRI